MIKTYYYGSLLAVLLFLLSTEQGIAQNEKDEKPLLSVDKGLSISKDSLFLLNLRFRMQNRFGFTTRNGESPDIQAFEARVRRLRLRFDGFVLQKNLQYYIQLSFSRADQDQEIGTISHVVRDAMVYYHFNPRFYMGFGQSKLPGNRERVVSSGNLQLPDRSMANSQMTLDRDFGFFAYKTFMTGSKAQLQLKAAITSGDGRNALPVDDGLAYTGRIEWLPFGAFKNNGDYSEGDLEFEPTPKLSVAAGYSANLSATRTGGTLGRDLYQQRDINTFIADVLFKYEGWAFMTEYFNRQSPNPLTFNSANQVRYVYDGQGLNVHLSKMISRKNEVVTRYTIINPNQSIRFYERVTEEVQLGFTRYLNGHRIKAQGMVGYRWRAGYVEPAGANNNWMGMFQVEFGI